MSETLPAFLKRRAERSYRKLLEQIEDLTPEDALRDRRPDWPGQPWGIGQDGSIAGIVYHVAAWKQMTLPLFQSGGKALTQAEFDPGSAPDHQDWPSIAAWLKQVGDAWNAALALLPESTFDAACTWEGQTFTLARIVVEMYEHDIQHAAQIAYLRQRHIAEDGHAPG